MRSIVALGMCVAGLTTAGLAANGVGFIGEIRHVRTSVEAPSPALESQQGATNVPSGPFANPHLDAGCTINWTSISGFTPPPTRAGATQDVLISGSQISVVNNLLVDVGGDPYGFQYPLPASGTARADALFQVSFFVASLTDYSYTFDFTPSSTLQTANLFLDSENHGLQQLFGTGGTPFYGTLQPDTYTLTFAFSSFANGDQAGSDYSSVIFNFLQVPEPTTGALLVMGGVVLGLFRRQRNVRG